MVLQPEANLVRGYNLFHLGYLSLQRVAILSLFSGPFSKLQSSTTTRFFCVTLGTTETRTLSSSVMFTVVSELGISKVNEPVMTVMMLTGHFLIAR